MADTAMVPEATVGCTMPGTAKRGMAVTVLEGAEVMPAPSLTALEAFLYLRRRMSEVEEREREGEYIQVGARASNEKRDTEPLC